MIIEVLEWPESQNVMDKPDWFFIMDGNLDSGHPRYRPSRLGDSAYARILDESEYTLLATKTVAYDDNNKLREIE